MIVPVRTVAPAAKPVDLDEAKSFARIDHSDHDTLVIGLIDAAIAKLDGRAGVLGRCLINQTWRQDYSCWRTWLRLPFPDVSSVTVKYYDADNVEQTVSSSLYELTQDERGSCVRFKSAFTNPATYDDRLDRVSVTLVAGYGAAASSVPEGLKLAIKMLVAHWYDNTAAGESMQEIPFGVSAIIAPYRRTGV